LGDAVFLANYRIVDHSSSNNKFRQTVVGGIGIKLPTGSYHYEEGSEKEVDNPNFQAGTGSTDFLLNGSYSLRYGKFAVSTGVAYKMNTTNKEDYHFGAMPGVNVHVSFILQCLMKIISTFSRVSNPEQHRDYL